VPLIPSAHGWRLDTGVLATIEPGPVKAALLMSRPCPRAAVFTHDEWQALIAFCQRRQLLVDQRRQPWSAFSLMAAPLFIPPRSPGMREKVLTVGSASKEYRMIGWRVGGWSGLRTSSLTSLVSASRTWSVKQELQWGAVRNSHRRTLMMVFNPPLRNGSAGRDVLLDEFARLRSNSTARWLVAATGRFTAGTRWPGSIKTSARAQ